MPGGKESLITKTVSTNHYLVVKHSSTGRRNVTGAKPTKDSPIKLGYNKNRKLTHHKKDDPGEEEDKPASQNDDNNNIDHNEAVPTHTKDLERTISHANELHGEPKVKQIGTKSDYSKISSDPTQYSLAD